MKKYIYFLPALISFVLMISGLIILPSRITTRYEIFGQTINQMPTILAFVIPYLTSIIGGFIGMKATEKDRRYFGIAIGCVGVAAMILLFVLNK